MWSKARESAEAMSLAFVLLDFQHAGETDREKERERETRMKRSTYIITISDNIAVL